MKGMKHGTTGPTRLTIAGEAAKVNLCEDLVKTGPFEGDYEGAFMPSGRGVAPKMPMSEKAHGKMMGKDSYPMGKGSHSMMDKKGSHKY